MDARLFASHEDFRVQRPKGADEDVHMLPAIADHIIERCTAPGDLVFDPFAGFGTTVERAVALGRQALGIELLPERVEFIEQRVPTAQMLEGDAREFLEVLRRHGIVAEPRLILTSPPYMTANEHEADPLTAYEENGGDYGRYLRELGTVAAQCARLVAPGGYVVWNLSDIHYRGHTTRLIDDGVRVLTRHLSRVGITHVEWDRYPHDLTADALLVFQRA